LLFRHSDQTNAANERNAQQTAHLAPMTFICAMSKIIMITVGGPIINNICQNCGRVNEYSMGSCRACGTEMNIHSGP